MKLSELEKLKLRAGAEYVRENLSKLDEEDFDFVRKVFDKVAYAVACEQQERDKKKGAING